MSFRIRFATVRGGPGAIVSCVRCQRELARYTADEIVDHAAHGTQYRCPVCDTRKAKEAS